MTVNKGVLALLAFVAAGIFFGLAVFDVSVSDINLIDAGLFSASIGWFLDHIVS